MVLLILAGSALIFATVTALMFVAAGAGAPFWGAEQTDAPKTAVRKTDRA